MDDVDERREAPMIDAHGIRPPAAYAIDEQSPEAGVTLLALRGEFDMAAASLLRERIDACTAGALVVDLGETTFIDSAILKELLQARTVLAARGVRLMLAAVPPPVRRLLDLTRTSELFDDAPDVATALMRLRA
jgi:anti-sigma B factor antagonist